MRAGRPLDEHDMEPARSVRAELNALFDIAGARRAGDQVDGARPPLCRANEVPSILVARHDLAGAEHNDVRVGEEIERRRGVAARHQQQRASLGDGGEARGQRHGIAGFGAAAPDAEQRPRIPGDRIEARIGRHDQLGWQVLGGEITRHLWRDRLVRGDPRDRRLHLLGHRHEEIDAGGLIECGGARRDQVAAMRGDALGKPSRRLGRHGSALQCPANAGKDIVARRAHRDLPLGCRRSAHRL